MHPGHRAVIQAAFADHRDHRPEPFDRWAPSPPTSRATTAGWTISPSWRRPGARGRAGLLLHSFAMFAHRGLRRMLLSVDAENPTGATKLYERVGMRVVNRWDVGER
jgi:ribosomal protein S18 acetylase RimI-like enzyme